MERCLLVVVVGLCLVLPTSRAAADDWRVNGALAALKTKDPAMEPMVIQVLGEAGAVDQYELVVADSQRWLEKEELRTAHAYALGRLRAHPEKTFPLLLQIYAKDSAGVGSSACDAFAQWRAHEQISSPEVLALLAPPAGTGNLGRWYGCVGIWDSRNLDVMLDPKSKVLDRMALVASAVVPQLRAEAVSKILARQSNEPMPHRYNLLVALGHLGIKSQEVAKALERASSDPKLSLAAKESGERLGFVARSGPAAEKPEPTKLELAKNRAEYLTAIGEMVEEDGWFELSPLAAGPLSPAEALVLIARTRSANRRDVPELRFWAIVLSGGDADVLAAASMLVPGADKTKLQRDAASSREAILKLLSVIKAAPTNPGPPPNAMKVLTGDSDVESSALVLLRQILDEANWSKADEKFLRSMLTLLPDEPAFADVRAAVLRRIEQLTPAPEPLLPRLGRWLTAALGTHFIVWLLLLITVYPRSRTVQAAMLFNPLGRAVTGWGYTQLLVLASPWLRRRLFHPLVDAGRDTEVASFDADSFYDKIRLAPIAPRKNVQAPVELLPPVWWTTLETRGGLVVIEGASGLGKTHVLKALLERARVAGRTCLFVRAAECNAGVLKEIEDRLALDHSSGFVHSMIHRGAIELFIDGLNEASPSGVASIAQFCERSVNARILITTQPMSWPCPRRAAQFRLLPLEPGELEAFLMAQWPAVRVASASPRPASLAESARSVAPAEPAEPVESAEPAVEDPAKAAYRERARAFLAARTSQLDLAVLQNRNDLAFVAYLLARNEIPNIHSLRKQVVDEAARAYEAASPGGAFPLAALGAAAVRVLETGRPLLEVDEIDPAALAQLAERKLLLHRGEADWLFRHDTITCYFAAQGVLAPLISFTGTEAAVDPAAITKAHLSSPRFVGVYLQLADSLPLPAAQALAAALREHGRATGDRTLEIAYQDLLDRRVAAR